MVACKDESWLPICPRVFHFQIYESGENNVFIEFNVCHVASSLLTCHPSDKEFCSQVKMNSYVLFSVVGLIFTCNSWPRLLF